MVNNMDWNEDKCRDEAKKFRNRTEWFRGSFSSFYYSKKHGFLNKICDELYQARRKITKEDCIKSALKYNDFSEWRAKEIWAYSAAYKFNIIGICIKHMEKKRARWTKEACKNRCAQFSTL